MYPFPSLLSLVRPLRAGLAPFWASLLALTMLVGVVVPARAELVTGSTVIIAADVSGPGVHSLGSVDLGFGQLQSLFFGAGFSASMTSAPDPFHSEMILSFNPGLLGYATINNISGFGVDVNGNPYGASILGDTLIVRSSNVGVNAASIAWELTFVGAPTFPSVTWSTTYESNVTSNTGALVESWAAEIDRAASVPEPSSWALLLTALGALMYMWRKEQRQLENRA